MPAIDRSKANCFCPYDYQQTIPRRDKIEQVDCGRPPKVVKSRDHNTPLGRNAMPHEGNGNMRIFRKERSGGSDRYLATCCAAVRVVCGDSCAFSNSFAGDSAKKHGNGRQPPVAEDLPRENRSTPVN
jgi:hypothetical protein